MASGHALCVPQIACLGCWMLRSLLLLTLTVILHLFSLDVAGMMYSFIHPFIQGGTQREVWWPSHLPGSEMMRTPQPGGKCCSSAEPTAAGMLAPPPSRLKQPELKPPPMSRRVMRNPRLAPRSNASRDRAMASEKAAGLVAALPT